jgi:hypothetical protein
LKYTARGWRHSRSSTEERLELTNKELQTHIELGASFFKESLLKFVSKLRAREAVLYDFRGVVDSMLHSKKSFVMTQDHDGLVPADMKLGIIDDVIEEAGLTVQEADALVVEHIKLEEELGLNEDLF